MPYKHITSEDRVVIDTLLAEFRNNAYIARRLGVDRSSIGREIARNSIKSKPKASNPMTRPKIHSVDGRKFRGSGFTTTKYEALDAYSKALSEQAIKYKYYYAGMANKRTKSRHKKANQKRLRLVYGSGSLLEQYVLKKLSIEQWSPDQIAGRLLGYSALRISPQAIYDYIYNSGDKKKLVKHLRHHGNKYRRKHGTIARVKNNKDNVPSIHDRDPVIETRTRLGDYEGDTVVGLDSRDRLLTYVDRTSGECLIGLILGISAAKITHKTLRLGQANKTKMRSITYDRGIEFTDYESIQRQTKATTYFADAYSSYQHGSNENLNGLIRQYYPKRADFKHLTQRQVNIVQTKLNNRPRKRYNYRTPVEQRATSSIYRMLHFGIKCRGKCLTNRYRYVIVDSFIYNITYKSRSFEPGYQPHLQAAAYIT